MVQKHKVVENNLKSDVFFHYLNVLLNEIFSCEFCFVSDTLFYTCLRTLTEDLLTLYYPYV